MLGLLAEASVNGTLSAQTVFATQLPCLRGGDTTRHENETGVAEIYKATASSGKDGKPISSLALSG